MISFGVVVVMSNEHVLIQWKIRKPQNSIVAQNLRFTRVSWTQNDSPQGTSDGLQLSTAEENPESGRLDK